MAQPLRATAGLGLSALLAIGATGLAVSPARAAGEYLGLSAYSGHAGATVYATGGNFVPGAAVRVQAGSASAVQAVAAPDGTFTVAVVIPPVASGSVPVTASATGESASNAFYVQPYFPTVTLSTPDSAPYSVITASGTDFAPGENITVSLAGVTASVTADAKGAFTGASLRVPAVEPGTQVVTARGAASGSTGEAYLYVRGFFPFATPSEYYILPGRTLTFSGGNFASGETVDVSSRSGLNSAFIAASDGSFAATGGIVLPFSTAGSQLSFTLKGRTSGASASLEVGVGNFQANAVPSEFYVRPNSILKFYGGGFAPNEEVSVLLAKKVVSTFKADKVGSFKDAGATAVPVAAGGTALTYTLRGTASGASVDVSVTVGQLLPQLIPSERYLRPGSPYSVYVAGMLGGETVTLTAGGAAVATMAADTNGDANFVGLIFPSSAPTVESLTFTATGTTSGASASADISIAPFNVLVAPDTFYAVPGTTVYFVGTGYLPGETVTYEDGSIKADKDGVFTAPIILPFTKLESVSYTFTGGTSKAAATATVGVQQFQGQLSLSTYFGTAASAITISGSGFAPDEDLAFSWGTDVTGKLHTDKKGSYSVTGTVPFGKVGAKTVTVTGAKSGASATAEFTVAAFQGNLGLSSYFGQAGSPITISGNGFAPDEDLAFSWGTDVTGKLHTDLKGNFSVTGTVPFGKVGAKTVTVLGAKSAASATAEFTVAAFRGNLGLSSYYGAAGSAITLTATGFAAGELIDLTWGGIALGSVNADAGGGFVISGKVPFSPAGDKVATITGRTSGATSSATFTVAVPDVSLNLSAYYGRAGSTVTISGSGFAPDEDLAFTWGTDVTGTLHTDKEGKYSVTGTVPFAPAGDKAVTVTGARSGATAKATYTVAESYVTLDLASYSGAPGRAVTFIGSGYVPGETVTVSSDRPGIGGYTFKVGADGSFRNSGFIVPAGAAKGDLVLTAVGNGSFTPKSFTYYVTGA